jgi:8-oxo-dGTP pyrophosphatase MutT (NUDIX family)
VEVERRLEEAGQQWRVDVAPEILSDFVAVVDGSQQPITRKSAVMVGLFEEGGEAHVIFTRRSFALRHHGGEVSFPGGLQEKGEGILGTALRETNEEVGIGASLIEPVGWLHPLATFASGSAIWPVIGKMASRPDMTIDPTEVDRVFTAPLSWLLDPANFSCEEWRPRDRRPGGNGDGFFPIYFYRVPGDLIWGATARIVTELLCVLTKSAWPDQGRVWG